MKKISKIPNKPFVKFTEAEKQEFKPISVGWKDEGRTGPVWVEFAEKEKTVLGGMQNVSRDYQQEVIRNEVYTSWFSYSQAEKIAERLGVKIGY